MNDHNDKPTEQYLKVITFLNMSPGHADTQDGEPIGILTVEHNGDIEQPMMIRLADIRRLFAATEMVLAHHGDVDSRDFVSEHCPPRPSIVKRPTTSPLQPTGLVVKARSQNAKGKPLRLHVIAGYKSLCAKNSLTMLICRCHDRGGVRDLIVKIGPKGTIYLTGHPSVEMLPELDWENFAHEESTYMFRMGGRAWHKLPVTQMKKLIGRKHFRVVRYDGG